MKKLFQAIAGFGQGDFKKSTQPTQNIRSCRSATKIEDQSFFDGSIRKYECSFDGVARTITFQVQTKRNGDFNELVDCTCLTNGVNKSEFEAGFREFFMSNIRAE